MNYFTVFSALVIVWNLITFILMGADKHRAMKGKWRIREKSLFISAFLLGGTGILCGMLAFRHKTRHRSFRLLVPAAIIVNIAAGYFLYYISA